ncbi:MAG: hypothetical protein NC907_04500, partial [Candidatus Omnitrophica bacterium]|nr:hypothetical protein [Candidatus Omnitrophota bacterium]
HIPSEVMRNLFEWAENGGFLFIDAGSAIYDKFNNPLNIDSYLWINRDTFNFISEPGNDYYGLPSLRSFDFVKLTDSTISETIELVCGFQKIKNVGKSEAIAFFSDGSPAIAVKTKGKGRLIISGFLPGISYMRSAVVANRQKERGPSLSDCPAEYPEAVRRIFKEIFSGLDYGAPVLTDNYLVEANLLEGKKAKIVTISNWSGKPVENLKLIFNQPVKEKPFSTENTLKSIERKGKQTVMTMDLKGAFDFIVIPE